MKDLRYLLYALFIVLSMSACGGDDDDNGGDDNGKKTDQVINLNKNTVTTDDAVARLEFPKLKGGNSIVLVHSTNEYGMNYAVEWDCSKKAQRWTCYEMYKGNSVTNWNRNNWKSTTWGGDPFQEDTMIPEEYRTTLADYRGSGFNRGHICPSADRLCSKDANEQTFYLSNMQPQWYNFNAGVWERMEERVRGWNKDDFRDTLYVCKGGTIDSSEGVIQYTTSGLIVPRYFFMAILCKNAQGYKAIAFWVEHLNEDHSDDSLGQYVISIDELEQKTGIDFFCNLPDETENEVESKFSLLSWGLK